jgi:uncharacterized protein
MLRYALVSVENTTRRSGVAERCRVARGIIPGIFGLHLLPRLQDGEGLLLPGSTMIDTTFMGYPIDLVFLDRERRVTRVVHDMKPWRMVVSADGGSDCLELPAGAAAASRTKVGDQLVLRELSE